MSLNLVKGGKEIKNGAIVRFLSTRDSALVHAIVNTLVMPVVDRIYLRTKRLRVEYDLAILRLNKVVKLRPVSTIFLFDSFFGRD